VLFERDEGAVEALGAVDAIADSDKLVAGGDLLLELVGGLPRRGGGGARRGPESSEGGVLRALIADRHSDGHRPDRDQGAALLFYNGRPAAGNPPAGRAAGSRLLARACDDQALPAPEQAPAEPLADRLVPLLEVGVPDGAVEVEDALLDVLVELQVQRPLVDGPLASNPYHRLDRRDPRERIERGVEGEADGVAERERRQERQDQVRPGACAPDAEGLSDVGRRLLLDAEARRGVDEAAEPEHRVDDKSADLLAHVVEPPLERRAHDPTERPDVVEHVLAGPLNPVGHDLVVGLRGRFGYVPVAAVC